MDAGGRGWPRVGAVLAGELLVDGNGEDARLGHGKVTAVPGP